MSEQRGGGSDQRVVMSETIWTCTLTLQSCKTKINTCIDGGMSEKTLLFLDSDTRLCDDGF